MQSAQLPKSKPAFVELAAGGLVWSGRGPFRKLAVVHRVQHRDWVLPKGKLEAGELPADAALREVREEAQVEARLLAPAGCETHTKNGLPKVTLYWHMRVDRKLGFRPNAEIDQVQWLRTGQALRLLTHPNERELLLREGRRRLGFPRLWPWTGGPRRDRLQTAIASARAHLDLATSQVNDTTTGPAPETPKLAALVGGFLGISPAQAQAPTTRVPWLKPARRMLDAAEEALMAGQLDVGWSLIHEVERLRILGLNERDLLARAISLRHEALDKLPGWRGDAVRKSLEAGGVSTGQSGGTSTAASVNYPQLQAAVFEGQFVLNTHFNNRYHQLGLQGQTLRYLVYILTAVLIMILVYLKLAKLPAAPETPGSTPMDLDFTLAVGVALFGALGGTLSAVFQISRASAKKIPDAILDGWVTLGRPLIGAASALFINLVLSSGVLDLIEASKLTAPLYLGFAFVAGFSESLVLRTAGQLSGETPAKS